MQFTRSLDVIARPDVLVVGAGCAGTVAAISAARAGASTLVVERGGFAGGYITGVVGASLDGFVDLRSGLPVVGGVVFDLARAAAHTTATGDMATTRFRFNAEVGQSQSNLDRHVIHFDIERFKLEADRLMQQSGAQLLYHSVVADALREGDRITGVVVANKGGLGVIEPKAVVDASGDADVAAFAGAPYDQDLDAQQPMSLHFRVGGFEATPEVRAHCSALLKQAVADGRLKLYGGPWMAPYAERDYYFNATRFSGNGVDPNDLSAAEIQGRKDARLMFDLFKEHVPAFKDAYFVTSGPVVGVRETRRIRGDRVLSADDIQNAVAYDDAVSLGAWWLDRHPVDSSGYHEHVITRPYDISYGTLTPQGLSNLWVAGRCHSAESAALASSRVTVTCMGMGQAAGTAAALSAGSGLDSRELDITQLQQRLLDDGAIIGHRADEVRAVGDAMRPEEMPSAAASH